jgi:hypothetical protein
VKVLITVMILAILIEVPAFARSATAPPQSRRDYDQSRPRRDSGGSWRCYPYCEGGTFEGRPVREWMKPDRW